MNVCTYVHVLCNSQHLRSNFSTQNVLYTKNIYICNKYVHSTCVCDILKYLKVFKIKPPHQASKQLLYSTQCNALISGKQSV